MLGFNTLAVSQQLREMNVGCFKSANLQSWWCHHGAYVEGTAAFSGDPPLSLLAMRIPAWITGSRASVTCFYPSSALSNTSFSISKVISHHLLRVAVWCQIQRWFVRIWKRFRCLSTLFFWLSFNIRRQSFVCTVQCFLQFVLLSGFANTKVSDG